jgi:hypothetical protein
MSGHFEKGRWIEGDEDTMADVIREFAKGTLSNDKPRINGVVKESKSSDIEIGVKVTADDSELDALVDRISESADYFRLMGLEFKVHRATFTQRLWYLITGKL